MSNDEVKEILWGYQRNCDLIRESQEEIKTMLAEATKVTSTLSDMPRGGGKSGFDEIVIKYLERCNQLNMEISIAGECKIEIDKLIKEIQDYRIEKVLRKLYIKNEKRKDIALEIGYDIRHVDRLHAEGIGIIKHVLECQRKNDL